MAVGLFKKISPEYVLGKAFLDMKKRGFDGLKPYLTAKALKKVELVQTVSTGVSLFTPSSSESGEDSHSLIRLLIDKLSECDWSVKDIVKDSDNAKAVIGFKYEEQLAGTIDILMIKEDKEWRIDNLSIPHFDKINIVKSDK